MIDAHITVQERRTRTARLPPTAQFIDVDDNHQFIIAQVETAERTRLTVSAWVSIR